MVFDKSKLNNMDKEKKDKPLIMLVDDEPENLQVLTGLLSKTCDIITAEDGKAALNIINEMPLPEKIQLIISDQRMPNLTGTEFFQEAREILPDTVRIILSGYSDLKDIITAINKAGIYKFIVKPFKPPELQLTVTRSLEIHKSRKEYAALIKELQQENAELVSELDQSKDEVKQLKVQLFSIEEELKLKIQD